MYEKRGIIAIAFFGIVLVSGLGFCQSPEDNWNDFLHYTAIGRFDLAAGFARKLIESNPDPVVLLELSESNPNGYGILLRMYSTNKELKEVSGQILDIIEQGRFIRRTDAKIIMQEIKRLSSTIRSAPMRTSTNSPLNFDFTAPPPNRRANSLSTANPTLCRVPRYLRPGLPSPTTSFIAAHSANGACPPAGEGLSPPIHRQGVRPGNRQQALRSYFFLPSSFSSSLRPRTSGSLGAASLTSASSNSATGSAQCTTTVL